MRIFFTRDTRTKPNRRRQYLNVGTRLAPVFALLPKIPDSGFFGKTAMRKPRPKRMFHVKLTPKTKLAHRKDSFIGACLMPNQVHEANIFLFYSTSIMSNRIISGIFCITHCYMIRGTAECNPARPAHCLKARPVHCAKQVHPESQSATTARL